MNLQWTDRAMARYVRTQKIERIAMALSLFALVASLCALVFVAAGI